MAWIRNTQSPFDIREIDAGIMAAAQLQGYEVIADRPTWNATTQHEPEYSDGEWVVADRTPEEIAAATAKVWNPGEFVWEFTEQEQLAIAASEDPVVKRLMFLATGRVRSNSAVAQDGLAYLVSVGLLTEAGKNRILNGT